MNPAHQRGECRRHINDGEKLFSISRRIWDGKNCRFKLLLQNGLPPFHQPQRPTQVAFSCFQSDGALRRLIQEDRDTVRFARDCPDQSKGRSS